jgi:hypothetical protein
MLRYGSLTFAGSLPSAAYPCSLESTACVGVGVGDANVSIPVVEVCSILLRHPPALASRYHLHRLANITMGVSNPLSQLWCCRSPLGPWGSGGSGERGEGLAAGRYRKGGPDVG